MLKIFRAMLIVGEDCLLGGEEDHVRCDHPSSVVCLATGWCPFLTVYTLEWGSCWAQSCDSPSTYFHQSENSISSGAEEEREQGALELARRIFSQVRATSAGTGRVLLSLRAQVRDSLDRNSHQELRRTLEAARGGGTGATAARAARTVRRLSAKKTLPLRLELVGIPTARRLAKSTPNINFL